MHLDWPWRAGVLDPQGPIGAAERTILLNATSIMLAVIIPVIVLTIGFAWWFRASNRRATYLPNWSYSGPIELVVWSIPALVVMFLGGIAWIGSHDLDPPRALQSKTKTLEVQVVALDWKWLFIYPEQGIASVNRLVVPVGTPLHFTITSASVMNSFFVPQLGSQIYAMAGMATQLHLQADKPGVYPGLSAQFSGDGFSDMRFNVEALADAGFEQWVGTTRAGGNALDLAGYMNLTKPSTADKPATFSAIPPNLFEAAMTHAVK
jgi:cytochrome o ubiquinol oxidase subunit 2